MGGVLTGAEIVALAALVFSAIAAVGVGWQIFRAEQIFPIAGIAFFIREAGTAYIMLEHGKPRETYALSDVEIRHYGDGNLWNVQVTPVYGRLMDGSEQYRPFMGPGAEPMKLSIALNREHGGVIEVTAYDSFRASNTRLGRMVAARRMRVDCDSWAIFQRRWFKWKALTVGEASPRLGKHEKPDPGLPPGVRLLSEVDEEDI